jgi:hypothetical protein
MTKKDRKKLIDRATLYVRERYFRAKNYKERSATTDELARVAKVVKPTIRSWVKGTRHMTLPKAILIATEYFPEAIPKKKVAPAQVQLPKVEAPPVAVEDPTTIETVLSELKGIKASQAEILSVLRRLFPIEIPDVVLSDRI